MANRTHCVQWRGKGLGFFTWRAVVPNEPIVSVVAMANLLCRDPKVRALQCRQPQRSVHTYCEQSTPAPIWYGWFWSIYPDAYEDRTNAPVREGQAQEHATTKKLS